MARARNIKPGFFMNEQLAEIECAGRLLFIGLWMLADRKGRLKDIPKRIDAEVFPYDSFDTNKLLQDLEDHGFIIRYKVDGAGYIQIINFEKHQRPHPHEAASIIPPFNGGAESNNGDVITCNDKQLQCNTITRHSPSEYMNDEYMNDEYMNDEYMNDECMNDECMNDECMNDESIPKSEDRTHDKTPYDGIIDHFLKLCPSLQQPKQLTEARRQAIRGRWQDLNCDWGELDAFFKMVEDSDFITGRDGKWPGSRGIDWIFKQANFVKIREGNYVNRSGPRSRNINPFEAALRMNEGGHSA